MPGGSVNKANSRQSSRHKSKYEDQKRRTKQNKIRKLTRYIESNPNDSCAKNALSEAKK